MSSLKKNILASALIVGLSVAGGAAAYNYGTLKKGSNGDVTTNTGIWDTVATGDIITPEPVAYQMLLGPSWNYIMVEDIIFDIQIPDNAVQISTGYTVRVRLNRNNCQTIPLVPGAPAPMVDATCASTTDGAKFDTSWVPPAADLVLDPALVAAGWTVSFDGYHDNGETASFRIIPGSPTPSANPGNQLMFRWMNAHLTSLNELANGATDKVDAEFWMVNSTNDSRFYGSTQNRTILKRANAVAACTDAEGADVNKFIDVADNWDELQKPKTRFSYDGRLGTAIDSAGGTMAAPGDAGSQVINLGDVTLTNTNTGSFMYYGTDEFTTTIAAGAGNNWLAFDNGAAPLDDVYLMDGTCAAGTPVAQGQITGSNVVFKYTAAQAGLTLNAVTEETVNLTVCGFVDSNVVIDDHTNTVTTTFFRKGAIATPAFGTDGSCKLLPLRYNGSTMEIFYINPGGNAGQESFVRLTNRSDTDGWVALEGIDDRGSIVDDGTGENPVRLTRVWVPAGASVQLSSTELENGSAAKKAMGGWGKATGGKWRAIVTAEFPGLVAASFIRNTTGLVLTNVTDTDTRGEQFLRDQAEGTTASTIGSRPSDKHQEFTPDFRGNGSWMNGPTGPNGMDGPSGGTTATCDNPGVNPDPQFMANCPGYTPATTP